MGDIFFFEVNDDKRFYTLREAVPENLKTTEEDTCVAVERNFADFDNYFNKGFLNNGGAAIFEFVEGENPYAVSFRRQIFPLLTSEKSRKKLLAYTALYLDTSDREKFSLINEKIRKLSTIVKLPIEVNNLSEYQKNAKMNIYVKGNVDLARQVKKEVFFEQQEGLPIDINDLPDKITNLVLHKISRNKFGYKSGKYGLFPIEKYTFPQELKFLSLKYTDYLIFKGEINQLPNLIGLTIIANTYDKLEIDQFPEDIHVTSNYKLESVLFKIPKDPNLNFLKRLKITSNGVNTLEYSSKLEKLSIINGFIFQIKGEQAADVKLAISGYDILEVPKEMYPILSSLKLNNIEELVYPNFPNSNLRKLKLGQGSPPIRDLTVFPSLEKYEGDVFPEHIFPSYLFHIVCLNEVDREEDFPIWPLRLNKLVFKGEISSPLIKLPPYLRRLEINCTAGYPLGKCNFPSNLLSLTLTGKFEGPLVNLPPLLRKIKLGNNFNSSLDNLPDSVEKISFLGKNSKFNTRITKLPYNFKGFYWEENETVSRLKKLIQ